MPAGRHHPALVFSVFAVLVSLCAWALERWAPEAFYQVAQEDGLIEWATFWAFTAAALLAGRVLLAGPPSAWRRVYCAGFTLGCLLIALEEISWGQRLVGFEPPEVFLAENFQQELNVHNFASSTLRQAALTALLLGFGVVLPLLARVPPLERWLRERQVTAPAPAIVPGFALAAALYLLYPWHNTGEWVELLAGCGFLCAALALPRQREPGMAPGALVAMVALAAVLLVGAATPRLIPALDGTERLALASRETAALAEDFARKRLRSRCGVHKRIFTFVSEYGARRMEQSSFWGAAGAEGAERAEAPRQRYFLDPWNLPYWIRHECKVGSNGPIAFVYSFGPNRRRDSTSTELRGDDVGHYVTPVTEP